MFSYKVHTLRHGPDIVFPHFSVLENVMPASKRHNLHHARKLCDRVAASYKGVTAAIASPEALFGRPGNLVPKTFLAATH